MVRCWWWWLGHLPDMKRILLAAALALLPAAASAQVYLPPGVSLPPQSVIGNTLPVSGNAVAVPFAQFGSVLGVPALKTCAASQWLNALLAGGILQCQQPAITDISGLGTGVATFLGTASSANLRNALTDETGTGSVVFATGPTLVNPNLGTPSAATLTNATGLPIGSGVTGLGTGVATALGVNTGGAGAFVVNGAALGTPSSGTATNLSGTAANLTAGHVTTNANLTGDVTSVGNATTYANVVPSTKGGAGTVNGILSANGAGSVSQGATTGLSDVTAPTTWTPSDQSGASLVFTSVTALYTKIGKHVTAQFRLTFPSTASGAAVTLGGLPVSSSSAGASFAAGSCISTAASNAIVNAVVPANATTLTLFNSSANDPTNANMSAATLTCSFSYISN